MDIDIVLTIERCIHLTFTLCYAYQVFYIFYMLIRGNRPLSLARKQYRYAVIICARNESNVIGHLIDSIHQQDYPQELVDVLVVADNCTDNTADVSREHGAKVFERFNTELVGKGYALDWLFKNLFASGDFDNYDGFFVFDADNLLEPNYITEMNKVFDRGFQAITSYRNTKNYDSNWISAGYSLWFLRESKYLNNARMNLGTSCAISGTGFLLHHDIIKKQGGWNYHLLTEDIEFTTANVIQGERIGYCHTAMFYDEQPITFKQSWVQRLRWSKGFYQVFHKYGFQLLKTIFVKGSFACLDILMSIFPALFLTLLSIVCYIGAAIYGIFAIQSSPMLLDLAMSFFIMVFNVYLFLYLVGLITTITEWNNIHCRNSNKILYTFTFPIFMLTYIPIAIVALFKKVGWQPIQHTIARPDVKK